MAWLSRSSRPSSGSASNPSTPRRAQIAAASDGQSWLRGSIRRLHREQRGFSLPEELVSLAVLAFAVGIVIAGIYTGTAGVKVKQGQVSAAALARSQLELIADGAYQPDPTAVPYPTVAPVPGLTVDLEVAYWTAPNGPFTATLRNDGMQKLTVTVSDGGGQVLQLEGMKVDR